MKKVPYKIKPYVKKVFETPGEDAQWGGYYNYDFLSEDGTKLLCNRTSVEGRAIQPGDTVEVGYYDIPSGEGHGLDISDSFHWPQATMLQWVPNTQNREVIFNLSKDGHLISRIINIETGEKRDLCYPIYCLTPDGKQAITLNLERSYWTPAYHYQSVVNEACNVDVLSGDGIFSLDLATNTLKTIVLLDDVLKLKPEERFAEGKHWLEHIMINPTGTQFVFLHRYSYLNTGRLTRMVLADIDGGNLDVIDDWQQYAWSHFGWKAENSFVMYSRKATKMARSYTAGGTTTKTNVPKKGVKQQVKSLLRWGYRRCVSPLIPQRVKTRLTTENGYQLYTRGEKGYYLNNTYTGKLLEIDGHPSAAKGGKYLITDSYADEKGYRRLLVLNTENGKRVLLGRFYSPFWGKPASCDLHPKLSKSENYIVIDTACSGHHKMLVFELCWDKIKEVVG